LSACNALVSVTGIIRHVAAGGIAGRKLVLDKRDAALTNYPPVVQDSCSADLAMVDGQAALDDTGLADRLKCGLPDIAP
jgi:hypothetical protein